jgi:hypothetical protein
MLNRFAVQRFFRIFANRTTNKQTKQPMNMNKTLLTTILAALVALPSTAAKKKTVTEEPKDPNEIDIKKVAKNAVNSILGICRPDFLRPNLISGLDPLKFLKGNK